MPHSCGTDALEGDWAQHWLPRERLCRHEAGATAVTAAALHSAAAPGPARLPDCGKAAGPEEGQPRRQRRQLQWGRGASELMGSVPKARGQRPAAGSSRRLPRVMGPQARKPRRGSLFWAGPLHVARQPLQGLLLLPPPWKAGDKAGWEAAAHIAEGLLGPSYLKGED